MSAALTSKSKRLESRVAPPAGIIIFAPRALRSSVANQAQSAARERRRSGFAAMKTSLRNGLKNWSDRRSSCGRRKQVFYFSQRAHPHKIISRRPLSLTSTSIFGVRQKDVCMSRASIAAISERRLHASHNHNGRATERVSEFKVELLLKIMTSSAGWRLVAVRLRKRLRRNA